MSIPQPALGDRPPSLRDQGLGWAHRLLPTHTLSTGARWFAELSTPWIRRPWNRYFVRRFGLDLSEAEHADPDAYPTFNALFTRALNPGARPLPGDPRALASPCDGRISACGRLDGNALLQAKGHHYAVGELIGDALPHADAFREGEFVNIYLSPRDYHRVHLPLDGWLRSEAHIPGRLLTVAPAAVRSIRGLFLQNERLVTVWETSVGPVAVVFVGAVNVGGIETVWIGRYRPRRRGQAAVRHYTEETSPAHARRGDEIGRFNLGSTVIVVAPPGSIGWNPGLRSGRAVRMGEPLARVLTGSAAPEPT